MSGDRCFCEFGDTKITVTRGRFDEGPLPFALYAEDDWERGLDEIVRHLHQHVDALCYAVLGAPIVDKEGASIVSIQLLGCTADGYVARVVLEGRHKQCPVDVRFHASWDETELEHAIEYELPGDRPADVDLAALGAAVERLSGGEFRRVT